MDWPDEVRNAANFDNDVLLKKTLAAMRHHLHDPWLLLAGFEGFYKFVPVAKQRGLPVLAEVEDMVRDVLQKYPREEKLRAWGSRIVEMLR